jgi:hypothetical protein
MHQVPAQMESAQCTSYIRLQPVTVSDPASCSWAVSPIRPPLFVRELFQGELADSFDNLSDTSGAAPSGSTASEIDQTCGL